MQKNLSTSRLPLLKACTDILSHIEPQYPILNWHVCFARKMQRRQLNVLFTRQKVREMMEGRIHYNVDVVLPFAAAFTEESSIFAEKCNLTGINV